nr:immunoglobulin light chain junction region [Macaca mulatta]
CQKYSDSPWTF